MNGNNSPQIGKLLLGLTAICFGLALLDGARRSILKHTSIEFKGAVVSPEQASVAAFLCLGLGLYFVIVWWRERKSQ